MTQQYRIGKVATHIHRDGDKVTVYYHDTPVVSFDDNRIVLKNGGWYTATTRTRMNQVSNTYGLGYGVYQRNFKWYVDYAGKKCEFEEGMALKRLKHLV